MNNRMIQGALRTAGTLFGSLLVGLAAGDIIFRLIPGSSIENVRIGHAAIAAVPALIGFLAGGAAWGVQMGHLAGTGNSRRMALAGMAGFAPITIVLAVGLGVGEPFILEQVSGAAPIHRVFTLLFVPSAFMIAGISAAAVGLALRHRGLAVALFWRVGAAAAITFLIVNLAMESLGWVVGAPGAAERFTMVTVLALGNIGAALIGGAVMGQHLYLESASS